MAQHLSTSNLIRFVTIYNLLDSTLELWMIRHCVHFGQLIYLSGGKWKVKFTFPLGKWILIFFLALQLSLKKRNLFTRNADWTYQWTNFYLIPIHSVYNFEHCITRGDHCFKSLTFGRGLWLWVSPGARNFSRAFWCLIPLSSKLHQQKRWPGEELMKCTQYIFDWC